MSRAILRLLLPCVSLCAALVAGDAQARTMSARIARVITPVATLESVQLHLEWPAHAPHGQLRLQAGRVHAPELGYRFGDLDWRCPLQRDGQGGWRCEGELRGGAGAPMRLALAFDPVRTEAALGRGNARIELHRNAATPETTRLDLTRVPLAWTQALLRQAWPQARITGGRLDGQLTITAAGAGPLRVAGPLQLTAAALDTEDGRIAAQDLGARIELDAAFGDQDRVRIDGALRGGELLFGTSYISLQQRPVGLQIVAARHLQQGWRLPRLHWRDGDILSATGSAALSTEAGLRDLDLHLRSADLGALADAYLSGWLGVAGLGGLQLDGSARAQLRMSDGVLREAAIDLADASIEDPGGRFSFAGLRGDVRYSAQQPVSSELRWRSGSLYGLAFAGGQLPFASGGGELRLRQPVVLPMLGGRARFEHLQVRPPSPEQRLDIRFGLQLEALDVAQLAQALDWPAFTGTLSGRIPQAQYRDDRLTFDGGLSMQLFGGDVSVSSLAMDRPFGVAPTLSADIVIDDLDLESVTGVFGFGSITGKLDGRIKGLRLVNWQPTAFDAAFQTDRTRGVRQRISQRAVQDLSSVGDASFAGSLQSQLIGLFDDFGYSRLGIACTLVDEVCTMGGLGPAPASGSAATGFTIVRGSGLPRLTVVGYNRRVDWPILVERLAAVGSGEVTPVVE
ncbi:hypothetical protein [Lysobacter sp. D1-1-M9]|uniref:hypothetical protein n=1 Tax=Novilysobacter longmucuonensis TaxID=3098603 RepID=UPI002FC5A061